MNLKQQYARLYQEIKKHKHLYYCLANPEITDYEYDKLEKQFNLLAKKLNLSESWVGCSHDK